MDVRRSIAHCPTAAHVAHIEKRLQPGDVILSADPAARMDLVWTYQRRFPTFGPIASMFTHVAMYIGDGKPSSIQCRTCLSTPHMLAESNRQTLLIY
jgi:cell wall-associated NlpC family hydrolase